MGTVDISESDVTAALEAFKASFRASEECFHLLRRQVLQRHSGTPLTSSMLRALDAVGFGLANVLGVTGLTEESGLVASLEEQLQFEEVELQQYSQVHAGMTGSNR